MAASSTAQGLGFFEDAASVTWLMVGVDKGPASTAPVDDDERPVSHVP